MLIAPALHAVSIPKPFVVSLISCLTCCCRGRRLPKSKSHLERDFSDTWGRGERASLIVAQAESDPLRQLNQPPRIGMGLSIARLVREAQDSFSTVRFPFLIFHDPADKITSIEGGRRLLAAAQTDAAHKQLVECLGQHHDVLYGDNVRNTHAQLRQWLMQQAARQPLNVHWE